MTEKPPIEPRATIIDIEGYRLRRGRVTQEKCQHLNIIVDEDARQVWCEDCQSFIDPLDALVSMTVYWQKISRTLDRLQKEAIETIKSKIHLKSAEYLANKWSGKNKMALCCPHCQRGILPEDIQGARYTNAQLEILRRYKEGGHHDEK